MLVSYQNCEIVKKAGGCFWKNRLLWVFSGEDFFHLAQFSLLSKEYSFCCLSKEKDSGKVVIEEAVQLKKTHSHILKF